MNTLKNQINLRKPIPTLIFPTDIDQYELLQFLDTIPNKYYVRLVLQKFIKQFEPDLIDEIYEIYTAILDASPPEHDILTYTIDDISVKIQENPNIIAANGTTGFRTWEASIFLASYLRKVLEPDMQSTILELGCGTGLVGLSLVDRFKIIFTDMDMSLLYKLQQTIVLNHGPEVPVLSESDHHQLGKEGICQLSFGDWCKPVKYVVGSDITYSPEILPELINCLGQFLNMGAIAYIGATIRNEATIVDWEKRLEVFDWEIVKFDGVIKIYKIQKLTNS